MITVAPKLTNDGISLMIRGISGEQITFTRFKIGNGELNGAKAEDLTDLINPMVEFGVDEIKAYEEGYVDVTGHFDSGDITGDFRWTELGIFAQDAAGSEFLYAYANDNENSGFLRANTADVVIEQSVSVIVAIGTAEKVTALVTPSVLYASKPDFDNHIQDIKNPHKVTAEMLGLGNVQNVGTDDQTPSFEAPEDTETQEILSGETMSTLMGKIALAIRNLIMHMANNLNPHKVTAEQAGAAAKRHNHDAADINSGILGVKRGGTGVSTVEELKSFLGSGVVTGMYYGNGEMKRHIELGFKPVAVLVVNGRGMVGDDVDGVCGGLCVGEYGVRTRDSTSQSHETVWNNNYTALMISDSGFYVSYYYSGSNRGRISTNKSGESFRYIAWR